MKMKGLKNSDQLKYLKRNVLVLPSVADFSPMYISSRVVSRSGGG